MVVGIRRRRLSPWRSSSDAVPIVDDGFLARKQVAQRHREDIGTILIQEDGPIAGRQGFVVRLECPFLLVDGRPHQAVADPYFESMHGRHLADGKTVEGLDRHGLLVPEDLTDGEVRNGIVDGGVDVDRQEGNDVPVGRGHHSGRRVERVFLGLHLDWHVGHLANFRSRGSAFRSQECRGNAAPCRATVGRWGPGCRVPLPGRVLRPISIG